MQRLKMDLTPQASAAIEQRRDEIRKETGILVPRYQIGNKAILAQLEAKSSGGEGGGV